MANEVDERAQAAREREEAGKVTPKAPQILATHTLTTKETLSDLALKYYGHATEPYWRVIYEANKDVVGANPSAVRPGMVLKVPVLPEALKK